MAENADIKQSIEQRLDRFLEPEAPQAETQEAQVEAKVEQIEAPVETQAEAPEETQVEAQTEVKEEGEQPQEQDESVVEIESLGGLAEHLGVEVSDLYSIKVPVTVADGSKEEITLGQWKDDYKSSTQIRQARTALEEEKTAWEAERQRNEQETVKTLTEAKSLVEANESQLVQEFNSIDWDKLRVENPGEHAMRRTEMLERQTAIKNAKQQVNDAALHAIEARDKKFSGEYQETLVREGELLLEAIPSWKEEETAKVEKSKLVDYLVDYGFSIPQINGEINEGKVVNPGITDHRMFVITRKAMLYDEQVAKADVNKKKVLKIGNKVLRPGSQPSKTEAKVDALTSAKQKARKSGKMEDAQKAIAELL